jgi:hypothetical protein
MKRYILPILSLIVLSSCTMSKRVSVFEVPPLTQLSQDTVNAAAYEAKYQASEGVYLDVERTFEHYGAKEQYMGSWKFAVIDRRKFIVLNPEASWLTSFRLTFKPDTMYIRITTPDGHVRMYGKKDLKEEKVASGYTYFTLVYPDIVKGTIIEEGWSDASGGGYFTPLEHDIPLQYSIPCEHLKFTYACPDWWTLKLKKTQGDRMPPAEWQYDYDTKKQTIYYEGKNIPAVRPESFSPYFREVAQYLQFHITDLEMAGAKFDRPDSWQELADNFSKYALKKSEKKPAVVSEKAQELTANCRTAYEKLDTIVTFVQNNFDVVYKSSNANYPKILTEKKGEPAELTGLTQALLDHAGLDSKYLLVHSAEDGYFDPDYFDGEQFEAPAVRVKVDSLDYVVFPYMRHLPVNHVPEIYQGQMALQIDEGVASLWKTPEGNRTANTSTEDYDLKINLDGSINVKEHRVAHGSQAYSLRESLRPLDTTETRAFMREMLTYSEGDLTLDSFQVRNLEADKEPLQLDLYYRISNLVVVAPDEILFRTGGLFAPISDLEGKIDTEKRQNPIKINYDQEHRKNITIRYPDDWDLTTELKNVAFENDFGSIKGEYELTTGVISARQQVNLKRIYAEKTRISELADLIGGRSQIEIPTLIFKPGESGASVTGRTTQ